MTLEVFDATGRLISTLASENPAVVGVHTTYWDGTNSMGQTVQSGSYFYSLEVGGRRFTRGMVVIR